MGLYKYALKSSAPSGKAQGHDWDASYKDLTQVCRAIRGLPVKKAFQVMQDAIDETRAIEYHRFATGAGHRSNIGGQRGRYPKKECRLVTKLLKNAVNNAVQNGLDESSLYVQHASANKQNVFRRYRQLWVSGTVLGYGKHATWANYVTAHCQLVLRGKSAAEKDAPKASKSKKSKKPDAPGTQQKPAEKHDQKSTEKSSEKPVEKLAEKPQEKTAAAEKSVKPTKPDAEKPRSTIENPAPSPVKKASEEKT